MDMQPKQMDNVAQPQQMQQMGGSKSEAVKKQDAGVTGEYTRPVAPGKKKTEIADL